MARRRPALAEAAGRRTLITGAGSGIGRAVAVRLAERGDRLALLDRSEEALAGTVSALGPGARSVVCLADVTDPAEVERAVALAADSLDGLDTVVGSAGVAVVGRIDQTSPEDWNRVIAVNLTGMFLTARSTIAHLRTAAADGDASFTAISSDAGVRGSEELAAYTASKHGVVGLVRAMALDHGPSGVRSNAVCPGTVDTGMTTRILEDAGGEDETELWRRMVPMGRFARPEEVAAAVAHLSSTEASYVNGQCYALDGGVAAGFYVPR